MSVWAVFLLVSTGAPVSTSKGATLVSVPLAGLERTVKRVSKIVCIFHCFSITEYFYKQILFWKL